MEINVNKPYEKILFGVLLLCSCVAWAGGSVAPVGGYLYANEDKVDKANGALEVRFTTAASRRMVVAVGRKYRKTHLAKMSENGKVARFTNLQPDYYDLVVIDSENMMLHEGLLLHDDFNAEEKLQEATLKEFTEQIGRSLGIGHGLIGRWEQFFDQKRIDRMEMAGRQAGVFLQQMRLGEALAESGEKLQGCIHSIDMVWVEQTADAEHTWQVVNRQQLYRDEISSRNFFIYRHVDALNGIRVGTRPKVLKTPITLPED